MGEGVKLPSIFTCQWSGAIGHASPQGVTDTQLEYSERRGWKRGLGDVIPGFQSLSLCLTVSLMGSSQTTHRCYTSILPNPLHTITLFYYQWYAHTTWPPQSREIRQVVMTGCHHHLCLFNLPSPLRGPLPPTLTLSRLSQDEIFDSFREVCTSRKSPLWNQQKDTTKTERWRHTHAQISNTCVLKRPSWRMWDVLTGQIWSCLGSEVAARRSERPKAIFLVAKLILEEGKHDR